MCYPEQSTTNTLVINYISVRFKTCVAQANTLQISKMSIINHLWYWYRVRQHLILKLFVRPGKDDFLRKAMQKTIFLLVSCVNSYFNHYLIIFETVQNNNFDTTCVQFKYYNALTLIFARVNYLVAYEQFYFDCTNVKQRRGTY